MIETDSSKPATRVRFAPSPTGYIHIGNARTALFNWLFAQQRGGEYVLRLDDTDQERSEERFARGIVEDLEWLGIVPALTVRQSERIAKYDEAAQRLRDAGLLYPCYETPEELDRQRKRQQARRLPPIYDRSALRLTAAEGEELEASGRQPHWRFLLPNFADDPHRPERREVRWNDVIRGEQGVDLASMSDPVFVREDGTYLYTLPSVVDDIELGVSHVIRGDDHVTNTGAQIALFEALGASAPAFGHHNLLATVDGEGLSKRSGSLSIRSLREAGMEPMAVASLAVLTGGSDNVVPARTLLELADMFDATSASRSVAKFDPSELTALNAAIVHELPFDEVRDRLPIPDTASEYAERFWLAVRQNCETVHDASTWWKAIHAPERAEWTDEDLEFVRAAFDALPEGAIDETTWREWTTEVKRLTGRKGRALFMPLRRALTGLGHGPELAEILPLISREEILARRP